VELGDSLADEQSRGPAEEPHRCPSTRRTVAAGGRRPPPEKALRPRRALRHA